MFSALDEQELKFVVDAIEEIRGVVGDTIIKEGDQGDCMYVLENGSLDCTKVLKEILSQHILKFINQEKALENLLSYITVLELLLLQQKQIILFGNLIVIPLIT